MGNLENTDLKPQKETIEFLQYQPDSGSAIIFLKRDRDSKSLLERLGTNEVKIGSQAGFVRACKSRWRSRVESLDQSNAARQR